MSFTVQSNTMQNTVWKKEHCQRNVLERMINHVFMASGTPSNMDMLVCQFKQSAPENIWRAMYTLNVPQIFRSHEIVHPLQRSPSISIHRIPLGYYNKCWMEPESLLVTERTSARRLRAALRSLTNSHFKNDGNSHFNPTDLYEIKNTTSSYWWSPSFPRWSPKS